VHLTNLIIREAEGTILSKHVPFKEAKTSTMYQLQQRLNPNHGCN